MKNMENMAVSSDSVSINEISNSKRENSPGLSKVASRRASRLMRANYGRKTSMGKKVYEKKLHNNHDQNFLGLNLMN